MAGAPDAAAGGGVPDAAAVGGVPDAAPGTGVPTRADELVGFGWEIAMATLARAGSELTLVTHWFHTPEDASVHADDHFGSDERTLRFLGVVLPTLIDQLSAAAAVVALPWGLDTKAPTLTVIGVGFGAPARVETRSLSRLEAAPAPPFWRLASGRVPPPPELAAAASGLALAA